MSNFGLAELKQEGDTISFDPEEFNGCMIVRSVVDTGGNFYVIGSDGQPLVITKKGVDYFVLHHDKDYALTRYKLSIYKRFINYSKSIFEEKA